MSVEQSLRIAKTTVKALEAMQPYVVRLKRALDSHGLPCTFKQITVPMCMPLFVVSFGLFTVEIKFNFHDELICMLQDPLSKICQVISIERFVTMIEEFRGRRYDIIEYILERINTTG